MATVTMKQLLEAGVHFGHQVNRWNPKMARFIFGEKNGIYIIDLQQTVDLITAACDFLRQLAAKGGTILFVGTKRQAQEAIAQEASRCEMVYVSERWIGGTLTNFQTVSKSIARLKELKQMKESKGFDSLTKKELSAISKEIAKLEKNMGGLIGLSKLPNALFIIDPKRERNAVKEALKLELPVVALIDTNSDPDEVTCPIPGNDDAIKSIRLIVSVIAEAVIEGRQIFKESGAPVSKETVEVSVKEPIAPSVKAVPLEPDTAIAEDTILEEDKPQRKKIITKKLKIKTDKG